MRFRKRSRFFVLQKHRQKPLPPGEVHGERNQNATQRSGCVLERRSNGVSETARIRGGERYGVCSDEAEWVNGAVSSNEHFLPYCRCCVIPPSGASRQLPQRWSFLRVGDAAPKKAVHRGSAARRGVGTPPYADLEVCPIFTVPLRQPARGCKSP